MARKLYTDLKINDSMEHRRHTMKSIG